MSGLLSTGHFALPARRSQTVALILMVLFYLIAGVLHCAAPHAFLGVTPPWVPYPGAVVTFTGLCEIAGALGLLFIPTRKLAGVMLALYAVAVYPANILHAVHDLSTGTGLGWAYHYPRLFAQPLICWWALYAGGVVASDHR